jgi:hypothetical protein
VTISNLRPESGDTTVYVVELADKIEVFDNLDAARAFAACDPAAAILMKPLRRSIAEAVVLHDRRVVVCVNAMMRVLDEQVLDFYDGSARPPAADVEVYEKDAGEWHVVGFGTDADLLEARIQGCVVDVQRALSGSTVEIR